MGVNRWGIDVIEEATNMKFKNWTLTPCNPNAAAELESAGISPLPALVLAARGFDQGEQAKEFLSCAVSRLHDPMTMKGMPKAVERIRRALEAGETICVYGDYDVDGITATCLLTDYLRSQGGTVIPYVPDRIREGYSLNPETIDSLAQRGVTLIITVDCGITNLDEVAHASALGLDVVITDHHECKEILPGACAIVNPHQPDCPYPFQELAGVGVALKLVLALGGAERQDALLCGIWFVGMYLFVENALYAAVWSMEKLGNRQMDHWFRAGGGILMYVAALVLYRYRNLDDMFAAVYLKFAVPLLLLIVVAAALLTAWREKQESRQKRESGSPDTD